MKFRPLPEIIALYITYSKKPISAADIIKAATAAKSPHNIYFYLNQGYIRRTDDKTCKMYELSAASIAGCRQYLERELNKEAK